MKARGTVAFSEMTDLAEDYIDANYQGNRQDTPLYSPCQIDNHLFAECQANPGLSVKAAIDQMLSKVRAGKPLAVSHQCGA